MREAGLLALPFLLVRRVTPPSSPGAIPMAYPDISDPFMVFFCPSHSCMRQGDRAYLVGDQALVLPRISQVFEIGYRNRRTLRLYWFLRLRGSRENDTPPACALLTRVALLPPIHIHQLLSSIGFHILMSQRALSILFSTTAFGRTYG
jgi:hypothetical protein